LRSLFLATLAMVLLFTILREVFLVDISPEA
jgi:hypothetical protein